VQPFATRSRWFFCVPLATLIGACVEGAPLEKRVDSNGTSMTGGGAGAMGAGGSSASGGTTGTSASGGSSGVGTSASGGSSAAGRSSGRGGAMGSAGASNNGGTADASSTGGTSGANAQGGASGSTGGGGTATGGSGNTSGGGKAGAAGTSAGTNATGGSSATGGGAANGGSSGSAGSAGTSGGDWSAGNPDGSCSGGVPSRGKAVDTSNPTTVIGSGTAASCTFGKLQSAVTQGGIITFNCGSDPLTIAVTATLEPPINKNTVLDGGRKITLDGGQAVQILRFDSPDFQANDNGLTLQHIALTNGKQTPTEAIPTAPAPCSQGYDDGEGGAVYMRDGFLTVIDSIFTNNQAAPLGPDTGGGAIYVLGSKAGVTIVDSTFTGNQASNAGAVGGLFAELDIYNSLFSNNAAIGHDANNDDASQCSVMNNGQNEIGSGGNGGAIYSDGASVNVTLCGDAILDNAAGTKAFGGGLFFTSNDFGGTLSITDTKMSGNTGGHWTSVKSGSVQDAGTAVGTNAKSITIVNSDLQGL
jgi:hypothetical protein